MSDQEKKPRPWGTGSVYEFRGRWRARLPKRYGRTNVDGSFDTKAEAEAALAAVLEMLAVAPVGATTLAQWGEDWLPRQDVREGGLERNRDRWNAYVAKSDLASMPIIEITQHDVQVWLSKLRGTRVVKLSPQTKQNALSLLRQCFEGARERGAPLYGMPNPATDVTIGKRERARTTERWSWLRANEVAKVIDCPDVPLRARLWYTVAIFSGLRAGELCGLRWEDVDFERGIIHVRYSREEAPKNGEPREVPMLRPAKSALRRWRAICNLSPMRSHRDLVWPAPHGGCHDDGYDGGWSEHREIIGLKRRTTFHDLRHTCASHLLMGTWAPGLIERPLRLEELKVWLGHKDIKTTQRYAHLCPEGIAGLVQVDTRLDTLASRFGDSNPGPTVYEGGAPTSFSRAIMHSGADVSTVVSTLRGAAVRAADAIARGDQHREHRALDLIEEVEALCNALEAAVADQEKAGTA